MSGIGRWERKEEHRQSVSEFFKDFYSKNPVHNKVSDRTTALDEGRKYYISPTPCKKCGCVIKYVVSYGCHFCVKQKGYKKLMSGALKKYSTPEVANNKTYRYRTKKAGQTPNLTKDQNKKIRQIYKECDTISKRTGIPHHVDHIVPISKGGIHHPDNLQILTAEENIRKGNRL